MGYIARLKRGTRYIDMTTGGYSVGVDFAPPTVAEVVQTAGGTSANRRGGAVRTGSKATNAPFSFTVRVLGDSAGEIRNLADNLDYFLRQAGDESDPTYLEWKPDNHISFEPLWGQWGAFRRVEIVSGNVSYPSNYFGGTLRERGLFLTVSLEIKPYALGKAQRLGTAIGGILEDTIGSPDGRPRGTIIPEATTNKMTNPVFGHSTYDNGWTTAAGLIASKNTDANFILWGSASAKVTRIGATNTQFYQSIDAGNTNTHYFTAYVKKADSSAVTSSDMVIYYNGDLTTTFRALGNGWYLATATAAGVASAVPTGIRIATLGATVYLAGMQAEEKAYNTPLAYGDLLGCAWTGTAHASTSTRTAAYCKVNLTGVQPPVGFTWMVVWKASRASSAIGATSRLLWEQAADARLSINASDGQLLFFDGTNQATGAATAFSAGDILIIHAVMTSAGMQIYRNGAADGSAQTTIAPLQSPTYLWIGCNDSTAAHINGTFLAACVYPRGMTATEVANDYANIYQQVTGGDGLGQRVSGIPWLWTIGGDDVIDNYSDSTHADYAYVGGIDGSSQAAVVGKIIQGAESATAFTMAVLPITNLLQSSIDSGYHYLDYNTGGTAWTGAVGGTVYPGSVTTTGTVPTPFLPLLDKSWAFDLQNQVSTTRVVLADAGSSLYVRSENRDGYIYSPWKIYDIGTALTTIYAGNIEFPSAALDSATNIRPFHGVGFKRASGTAVVYIDYYRIMPGDITYIESGANFGTAVGFAFDIGRVWNYSGEYSLSANSFIGIRPHLYPQSNYLTFSLDKAGGEFHIDRTVTLSLSIIPRWTIA